MEPPTLPPGVTEAHRIQQNTLICFNPFQPILGTSSFFRSTPNQPIKLVTKETSRKNHFVALGVKVYVFRKKCNFHPYFDLEAIARQSVEASRLVICAYIGNIGGNSRYSLLPIFWGSYHTGHPTTQQPNHTTENTKWKEEVS